MKEILLDLEAKILQHREYLKKRYIEAEDMLEQIRYMLDFAVDEMVISEWMRKNRIAIYIVSDLVKLREEQEFATKQECIAC